MDDVNKRRIRKVYFKLFLSDINNHLHLTNWHTINFLRRMKNRKLKIHQQCILGKLTQLSPTVCGHNFKKNQDEVLLF